MICKFSLQIVFFDKVSTFFNTNNVQTINVSSNCASNDAQFDIFKCMAKKLLVGRDSEHEKKHLHQEISILQALDRIIPMDKRTNSLIIDVGGGNGILAYLATQLLEVDATVVDIHVSEINIDHLCDPSKFTRIVGNIANVNFNTSKDIYFICKHLCGTNLDIVVKKINSTANVKGFVLAPCCYGKGCSTNFCNQTIIDNEEFKILAKLTDWKVSSQREKLFSIGQKSEHIINLIRIYELTKAQKFNIEMMEYIDISVTPKNILLIGGA